MYLKVIICIVASIVATTADNTSNAGDLILGTNVRDNKIRDSNVNHNLNIFLSGDALGLQKPSPYNQLFRFQGKTRNINDILRDGSEPNHGELDFSIVNKYLAKILTQRTGRREDKKNVADDMDDDAESLESVSKEYGKGDSALKTDIALSENKQQNQKSVSSEEE